MVVTTDVFSAVALMMPNLRINCSICSMRYLDSKDAQVGYGDCVLCGGVGWKPTKNLHEIIQNIEYPFTLVLQNDMIGWMAEVQLKGKDSSSSDHPTYDNPVEAVYAALYRTLIDQKPKRRTRGGGRLIRQSVQAYEDSTNGS